MKKLFHFLHKIRFAGLLLVVILLFSLFSEDLFVRMNQETLCTVEESIHRAAVQCYALEGRYPPNLDYLKHHYGISYNSRYYGVDYRFIASNLPPEIYVFPISD